MSGVVHGFSGEPSEYRDAVREDGYVWTDCSLHVEVTKASRDPALVTCGNCLRSRRAAERAGRR